MTFRHVRLDTLVRVRFYWLYLGPFVIRLVVIYVTEAHGPLAINVRVFLSSSVGGEGRGRIIRNILGLVLMLPKNFIIRSSDVRWYKVDHFSNSLNYPNYPV